MVISGRAMFPINSRGDSPFGIPKTPNEPVLMLLEDTLPLVGKKCQETQLGEQLSYMSIDKYLNPPRV